MKLTKLQQQALNKMIGGSWHTAFELSVNLNTLFSLEKKGLVERIGNDSWCPRVNIKFKKL